MATAPPASAPLVPPVRRHVGTFEPVGRPTPFAGGQNEKNWKLAVERAIAEATFTPPAGGVRLAVRIEFRLRLKRRSDEPDPDNLLKSTFDAMAGVLGYRKTRGVQQADDERIDYIEVLKREAREGEDWGETIEVYELDEP